MPKKLDLGSIQKRISGDTPPAPEQTPSYRETPDYLSRRVEAQKTVATGKRERRIVLKADPVTCKIRADHDRDYSRLNEDNCRDLIEGIKVHGQEIPAIVRQLEDDPEYAYEIISGARRHWVASYLGVELLIEPRQLSDEEAFIVSDEENRNRQDISDYERARKYDRALGSHYRNQTQMAERMGVNKDWLSRYLDLAKMPEDIVRAYRSLDEIKIHHMRALKPLLKEPAQAKKVLAAAKNLTKTPLEGTQVLAKLKSAAETTAKTGKLKSKSKTTQPKVYKTASNKPFAKAGGVGAKLNIELNTKVTITEAEWLAIAEQIWADYMQK